MKKMLKIVAILLVVAAVVCVAGCSSKKTANTTSSSVGTEDANNTNVSGTSFTVNDSIPESIDTINSNDSENGSSP